MMNARADTPGGAEVPRSRFGMTARSLTLIVIGAAIVIAVHEAVHRALPTLPLAASAPLTVLGAVPLLLLVTRKVVQRGVRATVVAVSDGLLSLSERDYTLRLAIERKDEVGLLIYRFNTLAEKLRRERNDVYQKEILLETVLEASSVMAVICNEAISS